MLTMREEEWSTLVLISGDATDNDDDDASLNVIFLAKTVMVLPRFDCLTARLLKIMNRFS